MPLKYSYHLKISGPNIKKDHIRLSVFTDVLSKFNDFITHIIKFSQIDLTAIPVEFLFRRVDEGSADIVCQLYTQYDYPMIGIPSNIEREEEFITDNINHLSDDSGLAYYQKQYQNPDDLIAVVKSIRNLKAQSPNEVVLNVTDRNMEKIYSSHKLNDVLEKRADLWLEQMKAAPPKLAGEYIGCIADTDKVTIYTRLINKEEITFQLKESSFQRLNLTLHDLIRLTGKYSKEPGPRTKGVVQVENIHKINDEFTLSKEEYEKQFSSDPEYQDPSYRKLIELGYDIWKQNYAVFALLGEDE